MRDNARALRTSGVEDPSMFGNSMRENRETPQSPTVVGWAGRRKR